MLLGKLYLLESKCAHYRRLLYCVLSVTARWKITLLGLVPLRRVSEKRWVFSLYLEALGQNSLYKARKGVVGDSLAQNSVAQKPNSELGCKV